MDEEENLKFLSREVLNICLRRGWRLGVIETSTGGFISHIITNNEGSSRVFGGGLVLYSVLCKNSVLGIPVEVIEEVGVVSEGIIKLMIDNAKHLPMDVIIAETGIKGKSIENIPKGTTYIGIWNNENDQIVIRDYKFTGNREFIKIQTALAAFNLFLELFE
ncbi:MAG: CinA family protein [Promethearchaeota archaeon]